jgi:hypothetical protein
MQRFIFQTAIINRDGLYSYLPLSLEQAQAWLIEGPDPAFRLPLIASVVEALTGKTPPVHRQQRLYMHTGDEALIVLFQFPEDKGRPGYRRGQIATQDLQLEPDDLLEHVQLGLLRKFARLDGYTQSLTQWDPAFYYTGRHRYLVHDAALGSAFGTYHFARTTLDEAQNWLDEGFYISHLRYLWTCRALELLTDRDFSLWENSSRADIAMRSGDQCLVTYFHHPDGQRPAPFEPYSAPIPLEYAHAHTNLSLLTRLSDEFLDRNNEVFPLARRIPGEMRVR